jgi:hypothetical protein
LKEYVKCEVFLRVVRNIDAPTQLAHFRRYCYVVVNMPAIVRVWIGTVAFDPSIRTAILVLTTAADIAHPRW